MKKLALILATAVAVLGVGTAAHADPSPTLVPVPTIAPTWHAASCDDPPGSEGNVDIPDAGPGVIYALDTIPSGPGNYHLGLGAHTVDADAQDGYQLTGDTHWSYTVTPADCGVHVTPAPPVWHRAVCGDPKGSEGHVDIPGTAGVEYALDSIPGPAGHYALGLGTHVVTANAYDGYLLDGPTSWSYTVTAAHCPRPVVKAPTRPASPRTHAARVTAAKPPATKSTAAAASLPNTGAPIGVLTGIAALLILAGGAALRLARR